MMHLEENRFKSLEGLVLTRVTRRDVAKAGFYAPNRNLMENIVTCYFCNQKISSWDDVNDIFQYHQTVNPDCQFVQDPQSTTNVPEFSMTELKDERNRIATFKNWPVSFLDPVDMAKAGFYYLQKQDQAKCAWCGGAIGQWEVGDEPMFEHRKFFPNCPKVLEGSSTVDSPPDCGIQTVKAPKKQQYSTLESRTRTFEKWNHSHMQHPDRLAQAGFYFLGMSDEVRCFYCDGGLRFWQREDDPWFEHARCFPKCQFVQLVKGQQYIDTVLSQSPDEASTTDTDQPSSSNTSIAARTSSGVCPPMTLDDALSTEPVLTALAMGLNAGRIRNLTKMQLEKTGRPYLNSQELIEVVLDTQLEDEAEDLEDGGSTSSGLSRRVHREVTDLIWGAITKSNETPVNVKSENLEVNHKSTNSDRLSLEEENKRLKEARECKICMSEEVGVVFCPCGHLVSCVQCAPAITSCPLCRTAIKGRVRTFLS